MGQHVDQIPINSNIERTETVPSPEDKRQRKNKRVQETQCIEIPGHDQN